jgi:hypothetical protein
VNFQKFPLQLALRCSNISTKSSPISAVAQCYIELLRNYDELIFRQDVRDAPWQSFPVLFLSSSAALGWVRNHPARSASVPIANAIRDRIANPSRLQQFAAVSRLRDEFTIDALGQRLQELGSALWPTMSLSLKFVFYTVGGAFGHGHE